VGIKPSELLLIAVASCSAVDAVEILTKKRMPLTQLEISSSGEQEIKAPWTFRKIHLHFRLAGKNLTEKAIEVESHLALPADVTIKISRSE
jgi:putative redox protein